MQYRKLGRLDWRVSALGFGLERLPADMAPAAALLRSAIEGGVNYISAGWPYSAAKQDFVARVLAKALAGGGRDKVKIAAAIPAAVIQSAADFDRRLDDLLKCAGEPVDFLLFGGLNRFTWAALPRTAALKKAAAAIAAGKIKHLGFSFHDQYQFLRDVLDACDNWTLAEFQYSFMDIDHHPGATGLQLTASRGLGVAAARPLLGGRLTANIPDNVASVWGAAEPERQPAEWALRWVCSQPEVSTVVVDMSKPEQLKENLAAADSALPESFTVPEELVISRARDAYLAHKPIPCTACRGCMPCPQGVDVPRVFEIYNDALMYGDAPGARTAFHDEKHDLTACTQCETCAAHCGKQIPIPEWLEKARRLLA